MPGCQNKTDDFLTLFKHPAEVMGLIGFCHIFRNIRDTNTFLITCEHHIANLPILLLEVSTIVSSKMTFDVARTAMGNVSGKKSRRQEKRKKKVKKSSNP